MGYVNMVHTDLNQTVLDTDQAVYYSTGAIWQKYCMLWICRVVII